MSPLEVEPMRFDPAGWSIDFDGVCFQVWAPLAAGSDAGSDRLREHGRDHWQVAWNADAGERGDCRQGDTFEAAASALDTLPNPEFRAAVRAALGEASRATS